jgi:hypothetical protein
MEFDTMPHQHPSLPIRVGFISPRISGSDGVSLEIAKWASVLERMGHTCHYIAGQCDRQDELGSHPGGRFHAPGHQKNYGPVLRSCDTYAGCHPDDSRDDLDHQAEDQKGD